MITPDVAATVELLDQERFYARVRATCWLGTDSESAVVEIDARDASDFVERMRTRYTGPNAPLAEWRIANIRASVAERARDKALHTARDRLIARSFTPELRAEQKIRRPMQAMSPALAELTAAHRALCAAVLAAKSTDPARGDS